MISYSVLAARLLAAITEPFFTREVDGHLVDAEVSTPMPGLTFGIGYDLKLAFVPLDGTAAFDVFVCKKRPLTPYETFFVTTPGRKLIYDEATDFPFAITDLLKAVVKSADPLRGWSEIENADQKLVGV